MRSLRRLTIYGIDLLRKALQQFTPQQRNGRALVEREKRRFRLLYYSQAEQYLIQLRREIQIALSRGEYFFWEAIISRCTLPVFNL